MKEKVQQLREHLAKIEVLSKELLIEGVSLTFETSNKQKAVQFKSTPDDNVPFGVTLIEATVNTSL